MLRFPSRPLWAPSERSLLQKRSPPRKEKAGYSSVRPPRAAPGHGRTDTWRPQDEIEIIQCRLRASRIFIFSPPSGVNSQRQQEMLSLEPSDREPTDGGLLIDFSML